MNYKLLLTICLACSRLIVPGQTSLQQFSKELIANNLQVQAQDLEIQIHVLQNKASLIPSDPEIRFAHLWGSPSLIGTRKDLSVNQSIRFPSYYGKQRKMNTLSEIQFAKELEATTNELLYEALNELLELSYAEGKNALLNERFTNLSELLRLAQEKQNVGESNQIEIGKLNLLVQNARQDILVLESEKRIVAQKLVKLYNGDFQNVVSVGFSNFKFLERFPDKTDLISGSPQFEWTEINKQKAELSVHLAKINRYPNLVFGYTSEAIAGENLAGAEVGLSIPIWGKSNVVQQAKMTQDLAERELEITRQNMQLDLDNTIEKVHQIKLIRNSLEQSLAEDKTKVLLKKSYELGEISLQDYLLELPFYYSIENRILDLQKQYYNSLLSLNKNILSDILLTGK